MKRYLCLIIIIGGIFFRTDAAAEEYSPDDYRSFCVMQCVADAHFDFVKKLNQQLRGEAKEDNNKIGTTPASYWLQDARDAEPDTENTLALTRGVLYDPQKYTFYSKFGIWCFAPNSMYKCAQRECSPLMPKVGAWQTFWALFVEAYHVGLVQQQDSNDIHVLHTFYGTELPPVEFEEPPVEQSDMLAVDEELPEHIPHPPTPKLSFRRIRDYLAHVVTWWRSPHQVEQPKEPSREMIAVLEMARKRSGRDRMREEDNIELTEGQERLRAWRAMKERYYKELTQGADDGTVQK